MKYEQHLSRIIRAATGTDTDLPIVALERKVKAVAKAAPLVVAKYLDAIFHRAANAWVRGNNSGSGPYLTRCEKQCDTLRDEAERILQLWGVKVDYPGLYPGFSWGGHEYHGCEGLMRDIAAKKARQPC